MIRIIITILVVSFLLSCAVVTIVKVNTDVDSIKKNNNEVKHLIEMEEPEPVEEKNGDGT